MSASRLDQDIAIDRNDLALTVEPNQATIQVEGSRRFGDRIRQPLDVLLPVLASQVQQPTAVELVVVSSVACGPGKSVVPRWHMMRTGFSRYEHGEDKR